jgi:hypothetical protein
MRSVSTTSSKKSLSTFALALAAGTAGLTAASAEAAHFLTVNILGRVQGSGAPFTNSVVVGAGDIVEYQVRVQLGVEGSINPSAGAATTQTITNWVPSQGATTPTSGLNNLRFNLIQIPAPGEIQADFDAPAALDAEWAVGSGASGGTLSPRGDGNDNLSSVFFNRASGNFDGIGPAEELEILTVGSGVFDIAAAGNPSVVTPSISGFSNTVLLAGLRWRNAGNTSGVGYNPSVLQQNNSIAAGDPIIIYNGLNLVPEPAAVGVLALGAAMTLRRRRH